MQNSATLNIINTSARIKLGHKLNILHNIEDASILDLILSSIETSNICNSKCGITSDWSLCVSSDCLNHHSIRNIMFREYINSVVFIDHLPMNHLKKEDFIILQNALRGTRKITFGNFIKQSWPLDLSIINPGIPKYPINIHDNKKSIVLLSNHNKRQCKIIHQQMLAILPDAGIITEFDSLDRVADTLSMYRVALVFDGYINVLFAAACGCSIIANNDYGHDYIMTFRDSDSLNHSIKQSLKNYDYQRNMDIRLNILDTYDFDVFDKEISNIFVKQAEEPFII